jgi:hypothetical protein
MQGMNRAPELHQMIEGLQRTAAFHRDREAFHAQQQAHHAQQEQLHREERARHAAELEAASLHLEELRKMAERLSEVVSLTHAQTVPPETDEQAMGRHPNVSKAVDRVLAVWPAGVSFTATTLAAEVSRRFSGVLRRAVEPRVVAAALRRRRGEGVVEEVREGRPFQEALYKKRG